MGRLLRAPKDRRGTLCPDALEVVLRLDGGTGRHWAGCPPSLSVAFGDKGSGCLRCERPRHTCLGASRSHG